MQNHWKKLLLGSSALLLAAACERAETVADEVAPVEHVAAQSAPDYAAIAAAAVNNPNRWPDDSAKDERRKPAETLAFFEIAPGMNVFEIEAGGGYFTELYSHAVGPEGSVVMQNPEGFLSFFGEELTVRIADGRLANVRQSLSIFDAFDAADGSMDLVTWVQGPHELYYKPEDGTSLGDPAASYAEIFRILKPGGVFAAIDHSAAAGAPESSGDELHRIDKALVIRMAEEAGFVLDGEGDFLANPEDDRTIMVFDPAVRGKTDQFALRFRKPE